MRRLRQRTAALATLAAFSLLGACAALQDIIQPPIFEMASGRSSEVRLLGPSVSRPLGGAQIRVWARVENPNAVGFTLTRLAGNVLLDDQHAATVDLPLGLPLQAAGDTVIPLDVGVSFADIPELAERIANAVSGGRIHYALRGIVSVDAGALGQPSFGPSTWLSGDVSVIR
jgi:hypothetical protein